MNKVPLKITSGACQATFSEIFHQLDYVRAEGWISAPSKGQGFEFSGQVGALIGRKSLGGYCDEDKGPVMFPFSFDTNREYILKLHRFETQEEIVTRLHKAIRRAAKLVTKAREEALYLRHTSEPRPLSEALGQLEGGAQ